MEAILRANPDSLSFTRSLGSKLWLEHYPQNPTKQNLAAPVQPFASKAQNKDLPRVQPKNKKKPWVSPPRRGGFLKKLRRGPPTLRTLPTPSNGLLVPSLIPVAYEVLHARSALIKLIPKLMEVVPVKVCKFCGETHVGSEGHGIATCNGPQCNKRRSRHVWTTAKADDVMPHLTTYHLYDRLKTVRHDDRFNVERLPAVVELCIQAGVDIPEYPTLRRTRPVKAIGRRLVEENVSLFEFEDENDEEDASEQDDAISDDNGEDCSETDGTEDADAGVQQMTLESSEPLPVSDDQDMTLLSSQEVTQIAELILEKYQAMRKGVKRIMNRYPVKVCGYCPEVHVGPRGHKVKDCGAFKHQWRAGQHGWQLATLDDFIPAKYVWHVRDLQAPRLHNELKRYYGQTPAVVELCVQAGAEVPSEFRPMMRFDVAIPDINEMLNAV